LHFQNNLNREERSRQDFAQAANPELRLVSNKIPFSLELLGVRTLACREEKYRRRRQFNDDARHRDTKKGKEERNMTLKCKMKAKTGSLYHERGGGEFRFQKVAQ
jgi:hypothetical protein